MSKSWGDIGTPGCAFVGVRMGNLVGRKTAALGWLGTSKQALDSQNSTMSEGDVFSGFRAGVASFVWRDQTLQFHGNSTRLVQPKRSKVWGGNRVSPWQRCKADMPSSRRGNAHIEPSVNFLTPALELHQAQQFTRTRSAKDASTWDWEGPAASGGPGPKHAQSSGSIISL